MKGGECVGEAVSRPIRTSQLEDAPVPRSEVFLANSLRGRRHVIEGIVTHMPVFVAPSRPGRPSMHPLDSLRTRIWFQGLSAMSSKSAKDLEKFLDSDKIRVDETGRKVRPRKWDRYRLGANVPSDQPDGALERAERAYPGTSILFRHPLWEALRSEPMTADQSLFALARLSEPARSLILASEGGGTVPPPPWGQRPRVVVEDETLDKVLDISTPIDAFAIAAILAKRAESINSPDLRSLACWLYAEAQPLIVLDPILGLFHSELLDLADERLREWVFVDAGRRLDVMIFWRSRRDTAWPEDARVLSQSIDRLVK